MTKTILSNEEFTEIVQPLLGLPVSLPWKGFGTAIFFELGVLSPLESGRVHSSGEACIFTVPSSFGSTEKASCSVMAAVSLKEDRLMDGL